MLKRKNCKDNGEERQKGVIKKQSSPPMYNPKNAVDPIKLYLSATRALDYPQVLFLILLRTGTLRPSTTPTAYTPLSNAN